MRILILCALLSGACALPPPPCATARSDSEESEREAIQIAFDKLKDLTRAGGVPGEQFQIPERDRDTILAFLDRLYDIAVASVGDRELSDPARGKKQFLAVLDLVEEMTRAGGGFDGEAGHREAVLDIILQTKAILKEAAPDVPLHVEAFRPVLRQLAELARARGAWDQDFALFLSYFRSIAADVGYLPW